MTFEVVYGMFRISCFLRTGRVRIGSFCIFLTTLRNNAPNRHKKIRLLHLLPQRSFGSLHPPVSDRTFNPRWIASRKSPLFNTLVLSDFDLFVSVSAAIRSVETGWNGLVKQKRRHPRILPTKNGYFTDWIDFHIFARNEYRFVRTVKKQNTRNLLCSRHILSLPEEVRKDNPNPAGHQSPGTGVSP